MSRLPLLPLLVLAAAAGAKVTPSPPPSGAVAAGAAPTLASMPWPEQFHAVVITNLTSSGGRLRVIDMYYDWPRGRSVNVIRDQLSAAGEPPLRNVEWANGTSYLFDAASCATFHFAVGLLPPDWKKARGAAYLGRGRRDGFDCHVWSNFLFARYYEDAATGRPVGWNFNGMERHVLGFEVGAVLQGSCEWQAPASCFNGSKANAPAPSR